MTPETAAAFKQLHNASLVSNALDTKTKELIAVACGVTRLCEGCIVHHTKAAKNAGATIADVAPRSIRLCRADFFAEKTHGHGKPRDAVAGKSLKLDGHLATYE